MRLDETMTDLIRTRVSAEEMRVLMEAACKRGQTLSDLIRETTTKAPRRIAA